MRRSRPGPAFAAALTIAGLLACWSLPAEAQIPPLQWQILALGAVDVEGETPQGELQVNLGYSGIGLALGIGGGGYLGDAGSGGGGFLDIALQLRPLMFFAALREPYRPAYHIFDPHIDVGGLLGGVEIDDVTSFLGVLYIGAALDFGIPTAHYWMQSQVLLTFGYRFVPIQTPLEGFAHLFVLGIGYRSGY